MKIIDVVECIFGIARGDIEKIITLLEYTGLDTNKIDFIKKIIEEIESIGGGSRCGFWGLLGSMEAHVEA